METTIQKYQLDYTRPPERICQNDAFLRRKLRVFARLPRSSSVPSREKAAAGWPKLLDEVGLRGFAENCSSAQEVCVDYLPDDILAAPAYAQVQWIVAATAIIGAHTLKKDEQSAYPIIVGNNFQFDFRQHPTLGVVGAFSQFECTNRSELVGLHDGVKELLLACQHAEGRIRIGDYWPMPREPVPSSSDLNLTEPKRNSREPVLFGYTRLDDSTELDLLPYRIQPYNFAWLLFADTPRFVPAVFPHRGTLLQPEEVAMLLLNSKFWASRGCKDQDWHHTAKRSWSNFAETLRSQNLNAQFVKLSLPESAADRTGDQVTHISMGRDDRRVRLALSSETRIRFNLGENVKDSSTLGIWTVFEACLQFVNSFEEFQSFFTSLGSNRRLLFRSLVLVQLQAVDQWLTKDEHFREVAQNRTKVIYDRTKLLLDLKSSPYRYPTTRTFNPRWTSRGLATVSQAVVGHHLELLQSMTSFLKDFEEYEHHQAWDDNESPAKKKISRFNEPLSKILESDMTGCEELSETQKQSLENLKSTTELFNSICRPDEQDEDARVRKRKGEGEPVALEGAVDDILIWRALLMYILFSTALDSSFMLDSGV